MSLYARLGILAIFLLTLGVVSFFYLLYDTQKQEYLEGVDNQLRTGTLLVATVLGNDYHERVTHKDSVSENEYETIGSQLLHISKEAGFQRLWSNLVLQDGTIVFTSNASINNTAKAAFFDNYSNPDALKAVLESNKPVYATFYDKWGESRMLLVPFHNQQGQTYLLGASMSLDGMNEKLHDTFLKTLIVFSVILFLSALGIIFITKALKKSIRPIHRITKEIAAGNYHFKLDESVGSHEIRALAASINAMSDELSQREKELNSIIEHIPSVLFMKDANTLRFVRFNKAGEEMMGVAREAILGKSDYDFFPKEQADFFTQKDREVIALGKGLEIAEEPINTPKGQRLVHTKKVVIKDDAGRPLYLLGISDDITDKKALEEERILLSQALDTLQDEAYMIQNDGRLFYVNQAAADNLGYTKEEMLSLSVWNIDPNMNRFKWEAMLPKLQELPVIKLETTHWRKDGSTYPVEVAGNLISFKGEQLNLGIARDITERKRSEKKLQESEVRFHSIFDNTAIGIIAVEQDNKTITLANQTICNMLGYPHAELLKRDVLDIHPPEDRKEVVRQFEAYARGELVDFEYMPMLRADGSRFFADISIVAMPLDGQEHNVAIIQDVTQRYHSEQELKKHQEHLKQLVTEKTDEIFQKSRELESYFEAMQDGVGIAEVSTRKYVNCNKAFEQLTGYSKEEMQGRTIDMFFPEESLEYVFEQFEKNAKGEIVIAQSLPVLHKNGTITLCDVSAKPYEAGGKAYNVGVFRDITERKQFEQELQALNTQLEHKVEEKVNELREKDNLLIQQGRFAAMGEMLSMIAHQWRQPLTAVTTAIMGVRMHEEMGILKSDYLLEQLQFMETQAHRMSHTINDFMTFFAPKEEKAEFTLISCMESVTAIMKAQLSIHSITLHVNISDAITLFGVKNEIEHILLNLLSNARDAIVEHNTDERQISVNATADSSNVVLTVKDSGGGVPEAVLPRIFDPYYTTKEQGKGTGIGLYMSKTIIEQHFQGSISAANEQSGAVITVKLPVKVF